MSIDKKEIIIKEIKFWKENKMLPATYCDFLLTLYTEGESASLQNEKLKDSNWAFIALIIQLLFVFFPVSVAYFTKLNFVMQIAVVIFFLIVHLCFVGWTLLKKRGMLPYALLFTLFYFLIGSVYLVNIQGVEIERTLAVMLGHIILWYILGMKSTLRYYRYCSFIGLIIIAIAYSLKVFL